MFPFSTEYLIVTDEDASAASAFVERLEAAAPPPECPPPVWDSRPIDAEQAMAAVRAMSGG